MLNREIINAVINNQLSHLELNDIEYDKENTELFNNLISALPNNLSLKTIITYDFGIERDQLSDALPKRHDLHVMHLRADKIKVIPEGYEPLLSSSQPVDRKQPEKISPVLYSDEFSLPEEKEASDQPIVGVVLLSNERIVIAQTNRITIVNMATQKIEGGAALKNIKYIANFPNESDRIVIAYENNHPISGIKISIWDTDKGLKKEEKEISSSSTCMLLSSGKIISAYPRHYTIHDVNNLAQEPIKKHVNFCIFQMVPLAKENFALITSNNGLQQWDTKSIKVIKSFRNMSTIAAFPDGRLITGSNQGLEVRAPVSLQLLMANRIMSEQLELINIVTLPDNKHFISVYGTDHFYCAHFWETGLDTLIYKGPISLPGPGKIIALPNETFLAAGLDPLTKKISIKRIGLKLENTLEYQQALQPEIMTSIPCFPATLAKLTADFLSCDSLLPNLLTKHSLFRSLQVADIAGPAEQKNRKRKHTLI